jgi:hypothetical protein
MGCRQKLLTMTTAPEVIVLKKKAYGFSVGLFFFLIVS